MWLLTEVSSERSRPLTIAFFNVNNILQLLQKLTDSLWLSGERLPLQWCQYVLGTDTIQ